ncbi:MAG: DUF1385 domain-containing protein [Myxococcales bacterium]|jgi:uncharacterized protein YqhQ|nr:DUF1385 domain-containing protein [Myxococcales bacterium]
MTVKKPRQFKRLAFGVAQAARSAVGGQAVIEGVMMRSPKSFVVAVRRPDKQIVVREQAWETLFGKVKPLRWPFFRGAIVLIESLWNGMSALNFSAEQAMPEEEGAPMASSQNQADRSAQTEPKKQPPDRAKAPQLPSTEGAAPRQASTQERWMMGVTMVVSLALGLGLFVGLPHLLTWLLGEGSGLSLPTTGSAFHLIDGIFKALIFVAYLAAISLMPDIKRVFEYHGAEHKSIWAYEEGKPLTPESAATFTTLHPRCGTAFILLVLVVSIVLFAAVFPFLPTFSETGIVNQLCLIAVKLPLMLPVAGLAYELQRLSAKPSCPRPLLWLLRPGLWLQRITTREPSSEQIEVALVALRRALGRENGVLDGPPVVRLYADYASATDFDCCGDSSTQAEGDGAVSDEAAVANADHA